MSVKAIGFDVDGTLFDSSSVSHKALREGFAEFWDEVGEKGETPSWKDFEHLIGLPSYEFFPAVLPEKYRSKWELLHKSIGDRELKGLREGRGRTFDGVHETLAELKNRGYILMVLSNASRDYFELVLDSCDLKKYFSKLRYLGEDPSREKHDVLKEWAGESGGTDKVIYVGDRKADIDSAHEAGIKAVGVTWGFGDSSELREADWLIDMMKELLDIF
jgi:HAD superfamily hydrolase (TIGR01549 family)